MTLFSLSPLLSRQTVNLPKQTGAGNTNLHNVSNCEPAIATGAGNTKPGLNGDQHGRPEAVICLEVTAAWPRPWGHKGDWSR